MNRKLFRSKFPAPHQQILDRPAQGPEQAKSTSPPEMTSAENFYWVKQMQARTSLAIVLVTGEKLLGTVEWYDRGCIKLTSQGALNLLIFKRSIKYVYKDSHPGLTSRNGK